MNINKDFELCGWGQFVAIEQPSDDLKQKNRAPIYQRQKYIPNLENVNETDERDDLLNDDDNKKSQSRTCGFDVVMECSAYFGLLCLSVMCLPYLFSRK
jgi:hypothetical protein